MSAKIEREISLCASAAPISATKLRAAALRELNGGGTVNAACDRVRALAETARSGRASGQDSDLLRG